MDEHDPQRRVAHYRLDRLAASDEAEPAARDAGAPKDAEQQPAAPRPPSMLSRAAFADELVRQAMARGEFDDLPLAGKPIPGLTGRHDPDWWLKAFIEREQITGVLPEALQLRKDDAVLDGRLDRLATPAEVREALEEFNGRIVEARRQLLGGPPVVTPLRDVEGEVARWHGRRVARQADAVRAAGDAARVTGDRGRPGRWRRAAGWLRRSASAG